MKTGKSKQKRKHHHRTDRFRRNAALIHDFYPNVTRCLHPSSPSLTVNAATTEWLSLCASKYKRSTCSAYQLVVEKHVKRDLGAFFVHELTNDQVVSYLNRKTFGDEHQPPLATSTVCSIITVLSGIFRCAEKHGIPIAAWDALSRPRKKSRETTILTESEQNILEAFLLKNLDAERLGIFLCLYTGLRIGEICALKWGDISTDGILTVRRTVQRIQNPDGGKEGQPRTVVVFDTPKSENSLRSIPLPSTTKEILEPFRCSSGCYLLTGSESHFCEPRTLQNHFKKILKQAGLREINFHALRHTFATNCVQLGFDAKTLSRILGHATVGITLNTYVHPSLAIMKTMMERLNKHA